MNPIPWTMTVVTFTSIRYGGEQHDLTDKEAKLAKIIADQYPAAMHEASRGRLAIQARTVIETDTYDLDQFIADNDTAIRKNGSTGAWMSQGLARPVTDTYGADKTRGTIILVGQSQLNQGAYGLTLNEGGRRFSSIQVSDGIYDQYVGTGRFDDVAVHETAHQFQGATSDAGQKQATNPADTGYGNPDWGRVAPYAYNDDPVTNWLSFLRVIYDRIDYGVLAAYVAANPADIDGPFQQLAPLNVFDAYGSTPPIKTAPDPVTSAAVPPEPSQPMPIRIDLNVTVTGETGVVVTTNAAATPATVAGAA